MMNAYFTRLYAYNEWANLQLLDLLQPHPAQLTEEIFIALSHYLAAQEIWISRIQGRPANVKGVWEIYDLPTCEKLAADTAAAWNSYVPTMTTEDYYRKIAYKNTKGDYYETPVIDIMAHCVNHATYHRAQIARLLRQAGVIPINTDFITYARLMALEV